MNLLPGDRSGVQWTLLLPLLSRARISRRFGTLFHDPRAVQIVELLSGPLPAVDDVKILYEDLGNAVRASNLDNEVKVFVKNHPKATIVNLGSGFDTAFSRNDNGQITWFDIDLPAVMEMRRLIIPETGRSRCIAASILDESWMHEIGPNGNGLFMIAGGVVPYFTGREVKGLLVSLADHFPLAECAFDAVSLFGRFNANRKIKKAGISSAAIKWAAGRNAGFWKWDRRIVVLHHFPMFANVKRSPEFDARMIRIMDTCDKRWTMSIIRLGFEGSSNV